MVKIAVLGYGTVGSGVVELIGQNGIQLCRRLDEEIDVKYILDLRDFPGDPYEDRVVHDFNIILNDPEVSIVCEAMGGVGSAYQFTKQALEAGKSVCTSNKELVAKHGAELFKLAVQNHCNYMYEASVGGGIPIIRAINNALTAEKFEAVTGILNGTTNYILTKMERESMDYAQALRQAQELGYAECNPEADVEGHDACRKIAILASLIQGRKVDTEKVHTEGIAKLTAADFAFAEASGMRIKLLAVCEMKEEGKVLAMVAPFMISMEHPLAMVNDVYNGILVTGNMLEDCMFYGRGAGKLPTASAVVADVVECARNQGRTVMGIWTEEEAELADITETERRFFVRVSADAAEDVAAAFPEGEFVELPEAVSGGEKGFFTQSMKEQTFAEKCSGLKESVHGWIRLA